MNSKQLKQYLADQVSVLQVDLAGTTMGDLGAETDVKRIKRWNKVKGPWGTVVRLFEASGSDDGETMGWGAIVWEYPPSDKNPEPAYTQVFIEEHITEEISKEEIVKRMKSPRVAGYWHDYRVGIHE